MSEEEDENIEIVIDCPDVDWIDAGLEHEGVLYSTIPISSAIQYAHNLEGALLIPVREGKLIKVHHKEDELLNVLGTYKSKGLKSVLISQTSYEHFLEKVRGQMAQKFYNPMSVVEEKVKTLDQAFSFLKDGFTSIGVSKGSLELAEDIVRGSLDLMEENPNLFSMFNGFKNKCQQEFLLGLFTAHIASLIISKFPWQSKTIKEKVAMGAFLCDIILTPEDFELIRKVKGNYDKLPKKLKLHPILVSELLSKTTTDISKESLDVIEQHHEKCDGSGGPKGMDHTQMSHLAIIHNLARDFVLALIRTDFDYNHRIGVLQKLYRNYESSNSLTYIETLYQILQVSLPSEDDESIS